MGNLDQQTLSVHGITGMRDQIVNIQFPYRKCIWELASKWDSASSI